MKYQICHTACNSGSLSVQPDLHYRRLSPASKLFATRFGLAPATAMTIARIAGFPQLEEA